MNTLKLLSYGFFVLILGSPLTMYILVGGLLGGDVFAAGVAIVSSVSYYWLWMKIRGKFVKLDREFVNRFF